MTIVISQSVEIDGFENQQQDQFSKLLKKVENKKRNTIRKG